MSIIHSKIFVRHSIQDASHGRKALLKAIEKVEGFPIMSELSTETQSADPDTALKCNLELLK